MPLLFVCLVLSLGTVCGRAVPTFYRTNYYDVHGTNIHSLMASLRANRPFTNMAFTEWAVDWQFRFVTKPRECVLFSCDVRLRVTYTLPRWTDARKSDTALKAEWDRFFAALMRHEGGHSDFGVQAATALSSGINSRVWRARDQVSLTTQLDPECERILKNYKEQDAAYDESTRHGFTQGARLRFRRPWSEH